MRVVHGSETLSQRPMPVVTIGNFDGVHLGHRALIDRTRALAERLSAPAAVLTFDPAPQQVLRPDSAAPRIQSLEQKLEALATTGLDLVVVEPFTHELAGLDAEAFATRILAERIGVRGLALGHDFRFGKSRAGSIETLERCLDVPIEHQAAIELDGVPVSSSRIRRALQEGDVASAATCLGRQHAVRGSVVAGDQRGRTIGFPTANLRQVEGLPPARGVYATRAWLDGEARPSVANLGVRPTVDGEDAEQVVLEVHLLDFTGDLYGRTITVEFVDFIRGERAFDGLGSLKDQIARDAEAARARL
ncbi:MAG: bifunctional riboflavin kinase/FAD synthetase [Myxococcota bacterium]